MKKNILFFGIIVVLGACNTPKNSGETESSGMDSVIQEVDAMAMEVDSMVMEVDTLMTDSL